MKNQPKFETKAIRSGAKQSEFREHSTPIFPTSSFTFPNAQLMEATFDGRENGIIYSRYSNPNTDGLIAKMCELENAEEGIATASGMAAVFASCAPLLKNGDHLIASKALFGSTFQIITAILPQWGITYTFVDPQATRETWQQAIQTNTKMIMVETPSNPGLAIMDLRMLSQLAKKNNIILNVDNCFATPYLQKPLDLGADIVVHSATKWLDGQGRVLGGLVLSDSKTMEKIKFFSKHTGPAMSPFNAWILEKSIETLAVRMEKHCQNASHLADYLTTLPGILRVLYPFQSNHPQHELAKNQMKLGGGIIAFEVEGGKKKAMEFINQTRLCSISANLGDTRTIITHPASTTHSKLTEEERLAVGITPSLIRISVGLEHIEDIKSDLSSAASII
ncbi:MAG: trans-sulfuration enzyme family protein [Saprospiraceae bacterium]|jgi:O-succinylhomoserine sulfhydrylase